MAYHVDAIPNRGHTPTILLRRHWREGKRVRKETIANLTRHPGWLVEGIRSLVDAGTYRTGTGRTLDISRSLPHGHAAAILGTLKILGFERIMARKDSRNRRLALAAIAAWVADPLSQFATAKFLSEDTASSSIGAMLGLGNVSGNEILGMLDWLLERQPWIERSLANRRPAGKALILYDLSLSNVKEHSTALAAFGQSRDGRQGKQQTAYGLLCDRAGCPVAVEAFEGDAADPTIMGRQIDKIRRRFGVERVALMGGRGMIPSARVREELDQTGLDWISALNPTEVRKLMKGPLTSDVLVPDAVAEIASPDFPDERLMACINPRLRDENRLRQEWTDREVAPDGIWVVRTRLDADSLGPDEAVKAYKNLAQVEQAGLQIQIWRLKAEPAFVCSEARVRAHVFLRMLANYVEWHMRMKLSQILSCDDNPDAAQAQRVPPSTRSKSACERTPDGEAVHNFKSLLADLSTVALNDVSLGGSGSFAVVTTPTPGQQKAFELLGIDPAKMIPASDK